MSKISWRKNVLALVGAGYLIIFFVFLMLLFKGGMKVDEAYSIVNGPIMALIGGSLAIAKDLINADDESAASDIEAKVVPSEPTPEPTLESESR